MNSFSKRLLISFGGLAGLAVCATALTAVVEYKPWGVPDSRRQEYDEIIARLDQNDAIREYYAGRPRPIAKLKYSTHDAGLQPPNAPGSHWFEVRNEGSEPLELRVGKSNADIEVSIENPSLSAGQSTGVKVSWTNACESEDFQHTASLETNDPLEPTLQLTVIGKVRANLVVPDAVVFDATDPAKETQGSFVVYSQCWTGFAISNATCDLDNFDWHAEPISLNDPELEGTHATAAWRVRMRTTVMEYGRYAGTLTLSIEPNQSPAETATIALAGRVRTPIIFYSRALHMVDGLDIGTLFSGKERQYHVLVRLRGERDRPIQVLDVKPKELRAELTPQSKTGDYRLTVTVPDDCPMVVFNLPEQHGYVEVGDPNDEQFRNWIPINGAVVPASP